MDLDLDALRDRIRGLNPADRDAALDELLTTTRQLQARAGRLDRDAALALARAEAREPTRLGAALRLVLADYDRLTGVITPTPAAATRPEPT